MEKTELSIRELKLTAAIYAQIKGVLNHIKKTGKLPKVIDNGGAHIGMRLLIERRGTDITLDANEQLVYDAILKEGRLPGGSVRLVDEVNPTHLERKSPASD